LIFRVTDPQIQGTTVAKAVPAREVINEITIHMLNSSGWWDASDGHHRCIID
jgi:hypothetical protein